MPDNQSSTKSKGRYVSYDYGWQRTCREISYLHLLLSEGFKVTHLSRIPVATKESGLTGGILKNRLLMPSAFEGINLPDSSGRSKYRKKNGGQKREKMILLKAGLNPPGSFIKS